MLVGGLSNRLAVEVLIHRRDRDLDYQAIRVVAMGGTAISLRCVGGDARRLSVNATCATSFGGS